MTKKYNVSFEQVLHFLALLGFAVLAITLPISKGINSGTMVALLIFSLVDIFLKKFRFTIHHVQYFVLSGLVVFFLVSAVYSTDTSEALKFCYRQNMLLLLPLIWVVQRERVRPHMLLFLRCFILACAFAGAVTLLLFALPESTTAAITARAPFIQPYEFQESRIKFGLYSPFLDRLHFSYLLGLALLGLLWMWQKKYWSKWMLISFVIIALVFLFMGARGAQIGLLCALFIWLLNWIRMKYAEPLHWSWQKRLAIWAGVFLICFFLVPVMLFKTVPQVQERYNQLFWEIKLVRSGEYKQWSYEHFTSLRRLLSLKNHIRLIRQNPISGVGVGDYRTELQAAYDQDASEGLNLEANAQNQYLFLWASAGFLALCYFLWALHFLWRKTRDIQDTWSQTLAVSVLTFFIFILLFDIFIVYQTGATVFTICTCLIIDSPRRT